VTQCRRCDPEVVTVHLFTLATMVFVLQLIVNTITVKISVGFYQFPSKSKEFKKWEDLSRLNSLIDKTPAVALPGSLGKLSLLSLGAGKWSTGLLAGVKAGRVHLCRVAGNTVSRIWQVTSRSCEILLTIYYTRLTFDVFNRGLLRCSSRSYIFELHTSDGPMSTG